MNAIDPSSGTSLRAPTSDWTRPSLARPPARLTAVGGFFLRLLNRPLVKRCVQ